MKGIHGNVYPSNLTRPTEDRFRPEIYPQAVHGILKKRKVKSLFRRVENRNFLVGRSKTVPVTERGDQLLTTAIGGTEHGSSSARRGERDRNAKKGWLGWMNFSGWT